MGIKLLGVVGLAISLVACSGSKSNNNNNKAEEEFNFAAYCRPSDTDGSDLMGIVGGRSLASTGPIASSVVALMIRSEEGDLEFCTGTLLKGHMVLTAAHCTQGKVAVLFTNNALCEMGKIKAGTANTIRIASSVNKPEQFSEKGGTMSIDMARVDVGLLKYDQETPAGYTELDFPSEAINIKDNEKVILAGFGRTYSAEQMDNAVLRVTSMLGSNIDQSDKDLLIADQRDTGVCQGDSGSAMFVVRNGQLKIVGVTSSVVNVHDKSDQCRGYGIFVKPNSPSIGGWLKSKYDWLKQ